MVKKMRGASGAGLSACKKALNEADGDYDKAMEIMRQAGIAKAGKRAGREASQGLIHSYIHAGSKLGVMVEVNCETDFAARTDKFKELAKNIALQIVSKPDIEFVSMDKIPAAVLETERKKLEEAEDLNGKPDSIREKIVEGRMQKLLKAKSLYDSEYIFDEALTVEDYVKDKISVLGENIKVTRFRKMILGEMQHVEEAGAEAAEAPVEKPAEAAPEEPAEAKAAPEPKLSEEDELEQLKKDIGKRKAELKAQGMSGSQCNKDEQVVAWVARMTELKEAKEAKEAEEAKAIEEAEKDDEAKEAEEAEKWAAAFADWGPAEDNEEKTEVAAEPGAESKKVYNVAVTKSKIEPTIDEIIGVCKRRGIIFQSSEVYGGFAGFYDYGPLGVELRNNIKKAWWTDMVHRREDIVGLDSSIIGNPQIWQASGHIAGFSDPMVDCKVSKLRYRADQLFWAKAEVDGELLGYVSTLESGDMEDVLKKAAEKMKKKAEKQGTLTLSELKDFTKAAEEEYELIPSPGTGEPGSLTPPRAFNLMFQTNVGAMSDASSVAYMRPETAQGIFTNFKNVLDTGRVKVPFGIAQIGKAFRNEITPRNFIFRSREFEQMEIEYFIPPDEESWKNFHEEWLSKAYDWLVSIGLKPELISRDVHPDDDLAHYARACTDLMFKFPFGVQELQGVAARGNYDLTQHMNYSGTSMEYFDDKTREKYVPHVIEPSIGVDRLMLAVLTSAFDEDEVDGEKRSVLRFHPRLAPIKAAVLPLVKNKPEIIEKAQAILKRLQRRYYVTYDVAGKIGRRYRRQDEVGTPFCITVDYDTLDDDTVTLRERDSTEQRRMTVPEILEYLEEQIEG